MSMRLLNLHNSAVALLSSVRVSLEGSQLTVFCCDSILTGFNVTVGISATKVNWISCLFHQPCSRHLDLIWDQIHPQFAISVFNLPHMELVCRHSDLASFFFFPQQQAYGFEIRLLIYYFSPALHLEQNLCTFPQACAICFTCSFSRQGIDTTNTVCTCVCVCALGNRHSHSVLL